MATVITNEILEACAHVAHEANRAYCRTLGDQSQPPWDEAPVWQRNSALEGVRGVILLQNGPRESHEGWTRLKLAEGWRLGPEKDPVKKTHPCLVPYDELPEEQRKKDRIFIDVVQAVAAAMGAA